MIENDSQNQNHPGAALLGLLLVVLAPAAWAEGAAAPEAARPQAQQLVALIDYVAADYPRAVSGGQVAIASEYAEQQALLKDALELARALPPAGLEVAGPVQKLQALVDAKADGPVVASAVGELRAQVLSAYGVASAPTALPSKAHGQALYEAACAACHGVDGKARTPVAAELNPTPARFDEAERMNKLSPFRAFNAVSFGVKGTAMPAFDTLSEADKWDLASYLFTLRQPKVDAERARAALVTAGLALAPAALATQSDGEVLARLTGHGVAGPEAENALAWLRAEGAYRAPTATDLAAVRAGFEQAAQSYQRGQRAEARSALLGTYLDGFEPKEPALRARDSDLVAEVEDAFVSLRGAMEAGEANGVVAQRQARLDALLERTEGAGAGRGAAQVAFWGSLIIVLREGLEAALLVATLLSILKRAGRSDQARAVHVGWSLALALGVVTWFVSGKLLDSSGAKREVVEGLVQLLTAAFLFYASHWLMARAHAQRWVGFLQKQAPGHAGSGAVLGLAFLAVFREMFEVVVFYRGLLIEAEGQAGMMWLGAGAGGLALVVVVLGFLRVGKKLPLRPFLTTCGLLLCALSVVMVGHGVRALQEAGWLHLTPVNFHSISSLGIYNSAEGLAAQAALVLALAVSAIWANLGGGDDKPLPGNNTTRPAASP